MQDCGVEVASLHGQFVFGSMEIVLAALGIYRSGMGRAPCCDEIMGLHAGILRRAEILTGKR